MDEQQSFELLLLDDELGIPDPELVQRADRIHELCEPALRDELMAVYKDELWKLFKLRTPEYRVTDDDVARTFADIHARLPVHTDPVIISAIEAFLFRSIAVVSNIIGADSDGPEEPHPRPGD
ncbi:hypothetical protein [Nocardia testacea]|uniref:hypothetical protein n=1 Tax=Nocardia testacea TaxID=248551 RepID=UPI00340BD336